ncbi:helix-turn-helix transcriptional regulator [Roseivivax sediminis]|uniref:AraC-type DNA-binding protein n=1 Tax=Roseivivax sediminis TaxID=936889 RepID=A0A1I1SWP7_9RHOB|nr:AraC family transcriptional regulator [Roseivivax sediminis]SFD50816.1 AraC-type DNA-binding protein [Roseivivax sediminis]
MIENTIWTSGRTPFQVGAGGQKPHALVHHGIKIETRGNSGREPAGHILQIEGQHCLPDRGAAKRTSAPIGFGESVRRTDHRGYVRSYATAGSNQVGIADLSYPESVTVERAVSELVLEIQMSSSTMAMDIGGARRKPYVYRRGEFDVTPPDVPCAARRFDPGATIAVSLPRKVLGAVLEEEEGVAATDFGPLHEAPADSDLVLAICVRLLKNAQSDAPFGLLYDDTLIHALILELRREAAEEHGASIHDPHTLPATLLRRIEDHIDNTSEESVELKGLAALAGMSCTSFSRSFKRTTGQSPYQYVLKRRLNRAQSQIMQTKEPLAQIAFDCGFSSQAHMTTLFQRKLGVTPGQLRRTGC